MNFPECSICLETVQKPIQVSCCFKTFCSGCLHEALSIKSNCPLCRANIDVAHIESSSNYILKWETTLNQVEEYIIKHGKLPSYNLDTDTDIRELGFWISSQKYFYDFNWYIMRNLEIREKWENFNKKYPILNDISQWKFMLEEVIKFKNKYNRLPSYSSDTCHYSKELGWWITTQKFWYHKSLYIMKNKDIRTIWESFIN